MLRYVFKLLALTILVVYGSGCATMYQDVSIESNEDYEIRIYEVFGMN